MRFSIKSPLYFYTNLLHTAKCPIALRKEVNDDLNNLFVWLCSNRLSLYVAKTEFIIFRPPRKNFSERITLKINGCTIFESPKVKLIIWGLYSILDLLGSTTFLSLVKN